VKPGIGNRESEAGRNGSASPSDPPFPISHSRPFGPRRIVCLTEEPTEVLYALGEQHRIVGISGFTVRPAIARREKPKVSAFTSAKIDRISRPTSPAR
jgi:iron complex transport system substrate-binding protein